MPQDPGDVFELSGGALCLDLANTVDGRAREAPVDHLRRYEDLVRWAELAQVVAPEEGARLRAAAAEHPGKARRALSRSIAAREALYELFAAAALDRKPPRAALDVVNEALARALAHVRVAPASGDTVFERRLETEEGDLERLLFPVVLSAFDLLTSPRLERVTICAADTCAWLFLDESKNRSRRWCDMKICGNRAKARRHYRKKKR